METVKYKFPSEEKQRILLQKGFSQEGNAYRSPGGRIRFETLEIAWAYFAQTNQLQLLHKAVIQRCLRNMRNKEAPDLFLGYVEELLEGTNRMIEAWGEL